MRPDKLEQAKQLVGASWDQADATSYASPAKPEPEPESGPPASTQAESQPSADPAPDSAITKPASTAYGFVIPPGMGQELVQLGVRIPADLRAAMRTCSLMQQVEIQEFVRDALERELRRRAKS